MDSNNKGRKFFGCLLILISFINLALNLMWRIGRISNNSMSGDEKAFLITTILFGALALVGAWLLLTKEEPVHKKSALSPNRASLLSLRQRTRKVKILFIAYILGSIIAYVPLTIFMGPSAGVYAPVFLIFLGLYGIYLDVKRKCPNCNLRLFYKQQLILPKSCPECGISLI